MQDPLNGVQRQLLPLTKTEKSNNFVQSKTKATAHKEKTNHAACRKPPPNEMTGTEGKKITNN